MLRHRRTSALHHHRAALYRHRIPALLSAPRSQSFTAATPLRSSLVVVVLRRNPPVVRQRRFDAATLRSVLCDLVAVALRSQS
jgi:hypothetical protein